MVLIHVSYIEEMKNNNKMPQNITLTMKEKLDGKVILTSVDVSAAE